MIDDRSRTTFVTRRLRGPRASISVRPSDRRQATSETVVFLAPNATSSRYKSQSCFSSHAPAGGLLVRCSGSPATPLAENASRVCGVHRAASGDAGKRPNSRKCRISICDGTRLRQTLSVIGDEH